MSTARRSAPAPRSPRSPIIRHWAGLVFLTLAGLVFLLAGVGVAPVSAADPGPKLTAAPVISPTLALTSTTGLPLASTMPLTAEIRHVVIISIDGLRPDALAQADTPHLDSLIARGAYSPNALTISLSETLPAHASMLGGMVAEKHGILWGLPYMGWPGMNGPTLFSVAHDAGLSTAAVFAKEKLSYIALPGSVDRLFSLDSHDTEIKDQALEFIQAGLPNVLFIHLPDTDRVGHEFGWMSQHQLWAVTYADTMVGEIVAALAGSGSLANTLLIVTADHGGHGCTNGDDSPEDRTIPWLAVGPGVPAGLAITSHVNVYDTAATAVYALKLSLPSVWDGRPVTEIFQPQVQVSEVISQSQAAYEPGLSHFSP